LTEEEEIELLMGPQHPGSGHMRLIAELDGDVIINFKPDIGYVHRAVEKIAENKTYVQIIPLVERPALPDTANHNLGYILALEKLLDIEAPPRAQYLRTLLAEINRIHSHLYGLGIFGNMVGSSTMFMWAFADREILIELAQELTGARIAYSYMIPGGVRRNMPQDFKDNALKATQYMERRLKDYDKLFVNNPVAIARLEDVGVISKETAIKIGIVGPNLRASGVAYDVRKVEPYAAYSELDFDVPVEQDGDCYARLLVRREEIKQSIRIIRQIVDKIPEGPLFAEKFHKLVAPKMREKMEKTGLTRFPAVFSSLKPPVGEVTFRVEASRGEVLYYIVSDGSPQPYRLRMVTPSFRNVIGFKHALIGGRLADAPAVYGSLDYFPPEADR
jgi:NADH-quinone oxidoreductase subunit D